MLPDEGLLGASTSDEFPPYLPLHPQAHVLGALTKCLLPIFPPDPSPQVEVEEEILHLKEENQELKEKLDQQRVDLERWVLI